MYDGAGRQHGLQRRDSHGNVQGSRGWVWCRTHEDVDVVCVFTVSDDVFEIMIYKHQTADQVPIASCPQHASGATG